MPELKSTDSAAVETSTVGMATCESAWEVIKRFGGCADAAGGVGFRVGLTFGLVEAGSSGAVGGMCTTWISAVVSKPGRTNQARVKNSRTIAETARNIDESP